MKKISLYIFLFVSTIAWSQGSLVGTISEEGNKQFLSGAYVVLKDTQFSTVTNEQGFFRFASLPDGHYNLAVSFIGYNTFTQTIEIVNGKSEAITVSLSLGAFQLSDVIISANPALAVNMLSPVDIKLRPVNTSQDVLRMVPGLFIAQHAGGGKAEQIFLRGFDIDHGTDINLEVDGLPVNMVSHAHGQGYSDLHFLIPEVVQLVDFEKGPYYADKGDFTTAGFVSFRTKNHLERNFAKLEGGQFGTARAVAGVNVGQHAYIATEYFLSDGYFESPQDFNRFNLSSKYASAFGEKIYGEISASYLTSSWNASGQIPDRAVKDGAISRFGSIDDTEGGETSRSSVSAKFTHQVSEKSTVQQQAYAIHYDFNLYSNFTFYLNDAVNGDQIQQQESRNIFGYKVNYQTEGLFAGKKVATEIGAGVRYDDVDNIFLGNTTKRIFRNYVQQGDLQEMNANAYVSETFNLNTHWSVNVALRFDYFTFAYNNFLTNDESSTAASIVSPKLSLNYQVNDKLLVYLRNGFGLHSNDTRVAIAQNGKEILPRALGTDLGFQTKISDKLLVNAALWRLNLEQEFVYVGDAGIVEPSGESLRQGLDVSLRYAFSSWLFADVDLNVTKPRAVGEVEGEDYIPLAPTFTSIGGLSFKKQSGLNGSLRYRYIADRAANEDKSVIAEGYLLADLILNYTQKKYEVGFSVENLFNAEWKEAQFDTESRLMNETESVSEIHYTPGIPFFAKLRLSIFF